MSIHYNAFISYRHSPVDSRIAALVQRSLERFRVPRAIQKKIGLKKIDRLFRDKEELPITSDLNDDIAEALANSDFLIVICSPRTCESVWVQREIETFLKNHTRRQVLTVLAEGEPSETIPEILRYDEAIDPATGEARRIPIEPLSCDWRMNDRQAKREELPRLAAAILGCGYDELRQRQRQYKMRRITAGFSAVLAASLLLMAYFVRTSITIRENYEQALRNQSRYLASESLDTLEEGDRMTAIQLALAALPDGENDRPVVPKAELALSEAVGAYVTNTSDPVAVGAYITEGEPVEFRVVPESERIYILDEQNLLTIWDIVTSERIATIRPGDDVGGFRVVEEHLVVWFGDWIACYDPETGAQQWRQEFYTDDLAMSLDESTIIAVGRDADFACVICHIDAATGEITYRYTVDTFHEGVSLTFFTLSEDHISPDGTLIGFSVGGSYSDEELGYVSERRVYIYDWENGTGSYSGVSYYLLSDFCFTEDNDVIMAGIRFDDGSYGYSSSYSLYNYRCLMDSNYDILRVDLESGDVEWQTQIGYYQVNYGTLLELCPGNAELLCVFSNVCCRIDCATGEILNRGEATAAIVDVRMEEGDDYAALVLRDGGMANFRFEDSSCNCKPCFVEDLALAYLTRGTDGYNNIYVCRQYGNQVLRYSFGIKDENWRQFNAVEEASCSESWVTDDYLVTVNYSDQLSVYALDSGERLCCVELKEEEGYYSYELMGLTDDESSLLVYYKQYGLPNIVRRFELATGSSTDIELPVGEAGYMSAVPATAGEYLYCAMECYSGEGTIFCFRGFEEEEWSCYLLKSVQAGVTERIFVNDSRVILCDAAGVCRRIDLETMELSAMELSLYHTDYYADTFRLIWNETGDHMAAVGTDRIVLCDGNGTERSEIALNDRLVYGMAFHGEELFVLCSDYCLYRYDLEGNFLSRSDIASYINASAYPSVTWNFLADGDLALVANGVFSLISCDGWEISAYATQALGYDTLRDQLITYASGSDGYTVGAFRRYTTQALVEMGKTLIGESELSEETKSLYGIS